MREIEIKAKIANKQVLLGSILSAGIKLSDPIKQHDIVYGQHGVAANAPGSIWLRIRTENDSKTIFTLKQQYAGGLDSIEHETEVSENGFTGIYAGLAYAGFGSILKYVADKKATFISLLGLALVTIVIVIQPNVTSGALTVQLLSLAYLVIIVKDLIEVSKLLRGKK